MDYEIIKMNFQTAIHVGKMRLVDAENTISSDTIFSALCVEATGSQDHNQIDQLVAMAKEDKIRISDAMPFFNDIYYIHKPLISTERKNSGDSEEKKLIKKLKYLPADKIDEYLKGRLDLKREVKFQGTMGETEIRTMVKIEEQNDSEPYSVGAYWFNNGWGLYVVLGFEGDSERKLVEELFCSLGYSGIGGKRASGLGRFSVHVENNVKGIFGKRLTKAGTGNKYILISTALPKDEEMDEVIKEAKYQIKKRSGFVYSGSYSQSPQKKRDFYAFQGGSVFEKTFDGVVADVSVNGTHPVYRYAKPLFLEV